MAVLYQIGQRWISETEPELGLGSVLKVTDQTVTIAFPGSDEIRQYARETAPLRRVRFRAGDQVKLADGRTLGVEHVLERGGLLIYRVGAEQIPESDLGQQTFRSNPEERLLRGDVDGAGEFELRLAALEHQHRRRQSRIRGFAGGRIELLPHQLYIAAETASRLLPRVLLADEVGLGKTIEACLILHRLLQTGRVQRALVLVPEALVHQWFVELLRRFNLWFHIYDEERCDALETADPDGNPFLDEQLVLCSIDLLALNSGRLRQAVDAGWDLLVVDEAHHLGWSPDRVSPEYAAVEELGRRSPGLLLLTATPEQLGVASHFARLRLLDPDRYFKLEEFLQEAESYRAVAQIADRLLQIQPLSPADLAKLSQILNRDAAPLGQALAPQAAGSARLREELIQDLLDQHGTGRVMFRNTRQTVGHFPRRIANLVELAAPANDPAYLDRLAAEFAADVSVASGTSFEPKYEGDPRVTWLAGLLRQIHPAKVLLISRTSAKAEAIAAALGRELSVKTALFHEQIPLVQRDRNAAWFAEEEGAQILIASEIGSEGRNFQFAHHLVLFDLPLDPELLEQRIGRLDRIGQHSEIQIHVPFTRSSPQEVLVRWFHDGLNGFEKNMRAGRALLEQFGRQLHDLAQDFHETQETARTALDALIQETRQADARQREILEQGRDHLLELCSFRAEPAEAIVRAIAQQDQDRTLDRFMLQVFEHFGIQVEEWEDRTYRLGSAGVFADTFPGLPSGGLTVTTSRARALVREDIQFLTWDHPLVTGALDMIIGSTAGSSSVAHWPDSRTRGLYLETIFVLECVAPPHLHIDRFLPPTPIRLVVDHLGNNVTGSLAPAAGTHAPATNPRAALGDSTLLQDLVPSLVEKASAAAANAVREIQMAAERAMAAQLGHEINRLQELMKVNPNVRQEEIDLLQEQERELERHLAEARLRLDAVRLIKRG